MYNFQFIPTYMFYDPSLCSINPISSQYIADKTAQKHIAPEDAYYTESSSHSDDDGENEIDVNNLSDTFTSKYLYETEILHAFNMDNFNEAIINTKIEELYNHICTLRETNQTANVLLNYSLFLSSNTLLTEDEHSGFIILFSYQFFHITHLCISDLLCEDSQFISRTNIDSLIQSIQSFTNSNTETNDK